MRARLFLVLVITVLVAATGLTTVISRGTKRSSTHIGTSNVPAPPAKSSAQDPEEVIDGDKSPDKIPDKVAYTLLLRFLGDRKTEAEKSSARSYLRMIFGCDNCPGTSMTKEQRAAAQANIEKLLAIAQNFESQIFPVDNEARKIREMGIPNLDQLAKTRLRKLQAKKEEVVKQIMADLPARLGPEGAGKLHGFITEQFKRRVKLHLSKPKQGNSAAKPV